MMIGVVTLALLAGFGTLFLAERNRTPVVAQTPPPPAAIPASPGTVPEPQAVTPTTPEATSNQTEQSGSSNGEKPSTEASTAPARPDEVAQTQTIPPVPKAPPVEEIKPPVTQTAPANQGTEQAAQSDAPATPSTTTTPTQQPQTTPSRPAQADPQTAPARTAVATSENRVPLRSDYRISLGSFSTRRTVENQTSGVRQLGYTIHAIDLGDQYVAQVGPFADEATARRALADIQRTYPGALLYRPRNQTSTTESAASDQTAPSAPSTSATRSEAAPASTPASAPETTTSSEPQANSAPAPSGPTYLQVGAYSSAERAQGIVGTLHDNGFNPTVNSPEGKLTTVLVGPYSGDALLRAEARLDNAGLDHFRVR